MSNMTKFLKQTCTFESAVRLNGLVVLSDYGDITYNAPQTVLCRREPCVRDYQTNTGAILKTVSRYFFDETVEVQADDRIDGHVVLTCEAYVDQFGTIIGYEVYV